jgi:hypothetical protein
MFLSTALLALAFSHLQGPVSGWAIAYVGTCPHNELCSFKDLSPFNLHFKRTPVGPPPKVTPKGGPKGGGGKEEPSGGSNPNAGNPNAGNPNAGKGGGSAETAKAEAIKQREDQSKATKGKGVDEILTPKEYIDYGKGADPVNPKDPRPGAYYYNKDTKEVRDYITFESRYVIKDDGFRTKPKDKIGNGYEVTFKDPAINLDPEDSGEWHIGSTSTKAPKDAFSDIAIAMMSKKQKALFGIDNTRANDLMGGETEVPKEALPNSEQLWKLWKDNAGDEAGNLQWFGRQVRKSMNTLGNTHTNVIILAN